MAGLAGATPHTQQGGEDTDRPRVGELVPKGARALDVYVYVYVDACHAVRLRLPECLLCAGSPQLVGVGTRADAKLTIGLTRASPDADPDRVLLGGLNELRTARGTRRLTPPPPACPPAPMPAGSWGRSGDPIPGKSRPTGSQGRCGPSHSAKMVSMTMPSKESDEQEVHRRRHRCARRPRKRQRAGPTSAARARRAAEVS
jgi:hypothetical protein